MKDESRPVQEEKERGPCTLPAPEQSGGIREEHHRRRCRRCCIFSAYYFISSHPHWYSDLLVGRKSRSAEEHEEVQQRSLQTARIAKGDIGVVGHHLVHSHRRFFAPCLFLTVFVGCSQNNLNCSAIPASARYPPNLASQKCHASSDATTAPAAHRTAPLPPLRLAPRPRRCAPPLNPRWR